MNEPVTVTYSLEEVLKGIEDKFNKIDAKLDTLQKDHTDLKEGQATLTEKVSRKDKPHEKVESEQDTMVKAISDLQGFRSLVVPLVVAVATALLTLLFRLIPNSLP